MRASRSMQGGDGARGGQRGRRELAFTAIAALALTVGLTSGTLAQTSSAAVRRPAPPPIRYAPRGLPARRVGAAVRGQSDVAILALAPKDHLPETGAAHPSLYWRLLQPTAQPIEWITLTLTDVANDHTQEFVVPAHAKIPLGREVQRLRTDSLGIDLEAGHEYLWRVRVELSNGSTGTDVAYLRRRATASADSGNAVSRARAAAADGRWYDAFSALADSAAVSPRSGVSAMRDRYVRETAGGRR